MNQKPLFRIKPKWVVNSNCKHRDSELRIATNCMRTHAFRAGGQGFAALTYTYQYGKNVLYFFYNIAQRTLTGECREIFRVDIELYQHGS